MISPSAVVREMGEVRFEGGEEGWSQVTRSRVFSMEEEREMPVQPVRGAVICAMKEGGVVGVRGRAREKVNGGEGEVKRVKVMLVTGSV